MPTPQAYIAVVVDTTFVGDGGVRLQVKTALLNATDIGNTQVVAAVSGKKIRVIGYVLSNGGGSSINVNFQSATTAISSTKTLAATGGGMSVGAPAGFYFETTAGQALNLNLSAAGTVGLDITYVEVT